MKMYFALLLTLLVYFIACKKESKPTHCWQLMDSFGNELGTVCNKSEAEMSAAYPDPCIYYLLEGEKYCWLVNGQTFIENKNEDAINRYKKCFGVGTAIKVNCDYCQKYYTRLKQTYKPTDHTIYSSVTFKQYCGDTASTLYHGRQIILKDTPDSLILIQFSNNGVF